MLAPSSLASLPGPGPAAYVVDLIGDLDAALARSFADAVERLSPPAADLVVVRLKHVSGLQPSGVAAFASAIGEQKRGGRSIRVISESKTVRAMLLAARVDARPAYADTSARQRHLMIARNASPVRLRSKNQLVAAMQMMAMVAAASFSAEMRTPCTAMASRANGSGIVEGTAPNTSGAAPRMRAPSPSVTMINVISGRPTIRCSTSRLKSRATAIMPAPANPTAPGSPSASA